MAYHGSTVVYGRGKVVITGTGMNTEMGKIAQALSQAKDDATPLQIKLNQLSKILTILVIGICAVIFAVGLFRSGISGDTILSTFMVCSISCSCGYSGRSGSGCDHCTFHWRDKYVQTQRHHP